MRIGVVGMSVSATVRFAGPDAFDMVMMPALRQAHLVLEAERGLAIFAQPAVHRVVAAQQAADAVDSGLDRERWSAR